MDKQRVRVLILDDHEVWRKILFEVVAGAGYDAITAENLTSARSILHSTDIAIVILDLFLRKEPDARVPAEGLGLLKDISKLYKEKTDGPVVIVLSGSKELRTIEVQEISTYQNEGVVVRFLSKENYDEEQVRDALKRATEIKQRVNTNSETPDEAEIDPLDYRIEDQLWYANGFPATTEIQLNQVEDLINEIDVVLITATEEEIKAVMRMLEPYPRREGILKTFVGPETYYLGIFGQCRVVVTKCRMGAIGEGSVILAAEQAQRVWRPRAVIMLGIAFGKDPQKQAMADVMVASQIISYEQQRMGDKIIYHGPIVPSNATLLNRFTNVPDWRFIRPDGEVCRAYIGSILSGEKLVDDPKFKAELFAQYPQAIGGEMEGAGLCAAMGRMGVAWILVKAISDWGDGKKHNKHQPLAAAVATSLVHHVLSQKTVLNSINKPAS